MALSTSKSLAGRADELDFKRNWDEANKPEVDPADLWKDFQSKFAGAKDIFDTESDRMDFERMLDKISVAADERKRKRQGEPESGSKSSPTAPTAGDIVPSLTSRGGIGGQAGLSSALSYFGGGNLQVEANSLLRQIAANTKPQREPTNRSPVPGTGVGVFG